MYLGLTYAHINFVWKLLVTLIPLLKKIAGKLGKMLAKCWKLP